MSYGVLCSQEISIHALREEGDKITGFFYDSHHKFLSTPSARRATYKNNRCICAVAFLSTPSARRATRFR